MLRLLNPPPNHLTVCLDHGAPLCSLPHIDVNDVNTIANDPRVLSAGVSQEEARTYVRGVNDQVAKGVGKTHLLIPGSIGCAFLCVFLVFITRIELFGLVAFLFVVLSFASYFFVYFIMVSRLYDKAFAEWRQRGIVTRVEFIKIPCNGTQGPSSGPSSSEWLRLVFPPAQQAAQIAPQGLNVVTTATPSSPSMFTVRVAPARDEPVVPVATIAASTFTVQVPPDGSAGQVMQLQAPNGVMLQVQIPFGCAAGSTFEVAMPARA